MKALGNVSFHRHGHRAPVKNIALSGDELKLWESLLHPQNQLNFEVQQFNTELPRDSLSKPFGCITSKGIDHMISIGRKLRDLHPDLAFSELSVYSTNYKRTQLSAQALLFGLTKDGAKPLVVVRDMKYCSMSFYEGRPKLAKALIENVQATPQFKQMLIDTKLQAVQEKLRSALPGLARGSRGGIDWLAAFDYFVCRRAHGLSINTEVAAYEVDVMEHVSQRYAHYFRHKDHLAYFAVPLLMDLFKSIVTILCDSTVSSQRVGEVESEEDGPVAEQGRSRGIIFSGHDVNLLGLLFALQALNTETISHYWPGYGSTLLFQVKQQPLGSGHGNDHTNRQARLKLIQEHLVKCSAPLFEDNIDATVSVSSVAALCDVNTFRELEKELRKDWSDTSINVILDHEPCEINDLNGSYSAVMSVSRLVQAIHNCLITK